MRSPLIPTAMMVMVVATAVAATLSMATGPKQYRWTGTVTEIDQNAQTIRVDKGGDIWEFSTGRFKDLKAKKGDKVTVYYVTIAKRVEVQ